MCLEKIDGKFIQLGGLQITIDEVEAPVGDFFDENHSPCRAGNSIPRFYDFNVLVGKFRGHCNRERATCYDTFTDWDRCRERDSNPHGVTPAAF